MTSIRAAVQVVLPIAVTVMVAAPAAAEPGSALSMLPATGPNIAFPTVTTPSGCPAGSDLYSGVLYGKGLPEGGQLAIVPSALGMSLTEPFAVEMNYSFQDIANAAGSPVLEGVYTIELRCQDQFSNVQQAFQAQVDFATPTVFTAIGTAAPAAPPPVAPEPPAPAPPAAATEAPPVAAPQSSSASPSASAQPTDDPAATSSAGPGDQDSGSATPEVRSQAAEQDDSSSRPWLVAGAIVAGLAGLGIGAVALFRRQPDSPGR